MPILEVTNKCPETVPSPTASGKQVLLGAGKVELQMTEIASSSHMMKSARRPFLIRMYRLITLITCMRDWLRVALVLR